MSISKIMETMVKTLMDSKISKAFRVTCISLASQDMCSTGRSMRCWTSHHIGYHSEAIALKGFFVRPVNQCLIESSYLRLRPLVEEYCDAIMSKYDTVVSQPSGGELNLRPFKIL